MRPAHSALYRADIDGLRAVAILAVLAYHASSSLLPGGFIGVDIFFVISGYLITGILLRDLESGTYSIGQFYRRRVRRIFPALIAVLAFCWTLGWFALLPDEFKELGKHIGAASVFISNFVLWKESGYFDSAAELKPLLHLWSLGVEEQFYIVWPLMMWAAWKWQRHVLALIAVLFIGSLAANLLITGKHAVFSFYLPVTRFWELMAGGLLAYSERYYASKSAFSATMRHALSVLAVGLIVFACVCFTKLDVFPGWRALFPVLAATLLIAAGPTAWVNRYALASKPMVAIGLISYPLYLWHWPLLSFARIMESGEPAFVIKIIAVLLSFLLAWATYAWIETPVRLGRFKIHRRTVQVLIAVMVVLGLLGLLTEQRQGMPKWRDVNQKMVIDMQQLDQFRSTLYPCPDAYDAKELNWCFLSQDKPPVAAVLGDSHADHLFPGITAVDTDHSWLLIGHSGCPPLKDTHTWLEPRAENCSGPITRALQVIHDETSIRTVVIASLGAFYMGSSLSPQHTQKLSPDNWRIKSDVVADQKESRQEQFYRGLDRTVRYLEKAGKRVVFFIDTPDMDFMPVRCMTRPLTILARASKDPCGIEKTKYLHARHNYLALVARLKKEHPKLEVFDPSTVLCDGAMCYAGKPGILFYRDSHHLSIRGSELVARQFIPWLEKQPSADTVPAR